MPDDYDEAAVPNPTAMRVVAWLFIALLLAAVAGVCYAFRRQ